MKHQVDWGVRLRKTDGSKEFWPELQHQGKAFVVGTPGQGYSVRVQAPSGAFTHGQKYKVCHAELKQLMFHTGSLAHRPGLLQVTLRIDGRGAGISKLLQHDHPVADFRGFRANSNGRRTEQGFLYSVPQVCEDSLGPRADLLQAQPSCPAGQVQVLIRTAREEARKQPSKQKAAAAAPPAVQQIEGVPSALGATSSSWRCRCEA